jgi:hypothetical protein
LWDDGGVVGFTLSVGDFFKKKPQVLIRVQTACLGGLDQAAGKKPVFLPTTKGRIAFSAALLSRVIYPFSR